MRHSDSGEQKVCGFFLRADWLIGVMGPYKDTEEHKHNIYELKNLWYFITRESAVQPTWVVCQLDWV